MLQLIDPSSGNKLAGLEIYADIHQIAAKSNDIRNDFQIIPTKIPSEGINPVVDPAAHHMVIIQPPATAHPHRLSADKL